MDERFLTFIFKNIDFAVGEIKEAVDSEGVDRATEYLEMQIDELKSYILTKNS